MMETPKVRKGLFVKYRVYTAKVRINILCILCFISQGYVRTSQHLATRFLLKIGGCAFCIATLTSMCGSRDVAGY